MIQRVLKSRGCGLRVGAPGKPFQPSALSPLIAWSDSSVGGTGVVWLQSILRSKPTLSRTGKESSRTILDRILSETTPEAAAQRRLRLSLGGIAGYAKNISKAAGPATLGQLLIDRIVSAPELRLVAAHASFGEWIAARQGDIGYE